MFIFGPDPETGISQRFDLNFFLKIFIPSLAAILIGIYFSKIPKGKITI